MVLHLNQVIKEKKKLNAHTHVYVSTTYYPPVSSEHMSVYIISLVLLVVTASSV